ncbi:MAG TPA: 1-(5-phosphoribosyl)-5-[(5-phosphoribosylamino)methylideneamino] imidazole-4-carboxamide isomerase [Acidimicrobiales bacterium]|jgi:phosphoribosylformimino-5-aminoimidazole carboxamide ribotide isomerase|nr:1-(5-phosphoribosyl)-5-[(5-phosphoribosylamino)methylideneamino] imidazole-4-carboxamide isomerase [Acidimicrobiales bacterium]
MDLYPAIDLRDGRCVRLYQGDFARETVYGDDPVAQARRFAAAGASWLHVVDLDAARTGDPRNRPVILDVATALSGTSASVEASGGVRDDAAATALLDGGVHRVVVGTAALDDPDWVRDLAARHPGRVAVGLDARRTATGWEVAVRGWVEGSGRDLFDAAATFAGSAVAALVVTEIGRDGTLAGPDVDGLARVLDATDLPVVASGGVGTLADLQTLDSLEVDGRRLAGAIVGRALYEGAFTIDEALAAVAPA